MTLVTTTNITPDGVAQGCEGLTTIAGVASTEA